MSKATETAFDKLIGDATDRERQQIYKIKEALGLQSHDALWMVLIALQYHHRLYDAIPERIEDATNASARNAAHKAQAHLNHAIANLVPTIEAGVKTAAETAVKQIAIKESAFTIITACVIAGGLFLAGMLFGVNIFSDVKMNVQSLMIYGGSYAMLCMIILTLFAWSYIARDNSNRFGVVTMIAMAIVAIPAIIFTFRSMFAAALAIVYHVSN